MYGTDKKERSRREKRFIRQEEQLRQVLSEKKCRRRKAVRLCSSVSVAARLPRPGAMASNSALIRRFKNPRIIM